MSQIYVPLPCFTLVHVQIHKNTHTQVLQRPLLRHLLDELQLVASLELVPAAKRQTALGALLHLLDLLLDLPERLDGACESLD